MARAIYKCFRCKSEWESVTPGAARMGTGRPIHCQCGEVATLREVISVGIGDLSSKTAAEILKNESDWAEDDYHANILMGAKVLDGSADWTYHTQWSSGATLWYHANGTETATVRWDEDRGWGVERNQ